MVPLLAKTQNADRQACRRRTFVLAIPLWLDESYAAIGDDVNLGSEGQLPLVPRAACDRHAMTSYHAGVSSPAGLRQYGCLVQPSASQIRFNSATSDSSWPARLFCSFFPINRLTTFMGNFHLTAASILILVLSPFGSSE
jgi:hypothetical protein